MNEYDMVIKGGRVLDSLADQPVQCNIGVRDGVIQTLTRDEIHGPREIDAGGLTIVPGFIDVHTHVDGMLHAGRCMARMGVTTVVGGNCGMAMANGADDVAAFLGRIDTEGFPVHHGLLIGAQDLRKKAGVGGPHLPADETQRWNMSLMADRAMADGALGVSFGLALAPGISRAEVVDLFKVAARHEAVAAVHPRYFGPGVPGLSRDAAAGEEELIEAARESGVRLQISHLTSQLAWRSRPYDAVLRRGLEVIEKARADGLDVMGDAYPYDSWCMYPEGALLDALLVPGVNKHLGVDISMIEVAAGPHKGEALTRELYLKLKGESSKTMLVGHMMRQDLVDRLFLPSFVMVGSDGIFEEGTGRPTHPRGAGAFPRVIRRLVREQGFLGLTEALAKMTVLPARRFGLHGKGRIAVGFDADLAVFDPETLEDQATYLEPDQGVRGMVHVLVAGQPVVENGRLTQALPGRAVRPGL
ncbi:MAG: amidohydrolase family protein [Proteobacteria bacterium]|nr:amidohydrolase family protein [Pseudomonadota bacterium]